MDKDNYIRSLGQKIRAAVGSTGDPSDAIVELFDSYAVLALAKGTEVSDEDVHDAWSAWATKYNCKHDALIPFDQLSEKVRAKDTKYAQAIRDAVATLDIK